MLYKKSRGVISDSKERPSRCTDIIKLSLKTTSDKNPPFYVNRNPFIHTSSVSFRRESRHRDNICDGNTYLFLLTLLVEVKQRDP